MQRARRRFMCSTAALPSVSNVTLRPRRKSRTSSAGGDGFAVIKRPRNAEVGFESKVKPRSTKYNMRLLSSNLRNSKKIGKPSKAVKPSLGSLQNTIVLAPFHTLKRSFQCKLANLYSKEKMKRIDQKIKMAKKQNMAFEYDVLELKAQNSKNCKGEGKSPKKGPVQTEKKQNPKQKTRSVSYCQCKKTGSKAPVAPKSKKRSKVTLQLEPFNRRKPSFFEEPQPKTRKLSQDIFTSSNLKFTPTPKLNFLNKSEENFYCLRSSTTNLTSSAMSSRSKVDSWDTCSKSGSYREERLEGSLAISTTSFDSYMEQFEKDSCDFSEKSGGQNTRAKNQKENQRSKNFEDNSFDENFIPKPNQNDSRHLIMNVGKKNSDGQITDFLDREPQTQIISPEEVGNHLQPLRRQSKTKTRKQESDSSRSYYLRSVSSSREKITSRGSRTATPSERGSPTEKRSGSRVGNIQMEVVTQMEKQPGTPVDDLTPAGLNPPVTHQLQTAEVSSIIQENAVESTLETMDSTCESSAVENEMSHMETTELEEDQGGKVWESEVATERTPSDEVSIGVMPLVQDGRLFQESPEPLGDVPQPEEKETVFIFGGTSPTRLGESCEFSFGLNWELSDDEDSDHGNHLF